jgi:(S)-ureidoglycine aminohydrolase
VTHPPGTTRTALAARFALVTPDGHFRVPREDAVGVAETGLLGPGLGAGFEWTLIDLAPGTTLDAGASTASSWFVLDGATRLTGVGGAVRPKPVGVGASVALPAAQVATWEALAPTRLLRSRPTGPRRPPAGGDGPQVRALDDLVPQGFRGADGVSVRALPRGADPDLWFVLELQPGAELPFVETHPEPHGVFLLAGRGIARFDGAWHPVVAGDAVWIGAFCPHWFCALGSTPLRYLLLKQPAAAGSADG